MRFKVKKNANRISSWILLFFLHVCSSSIFIEDRIFFVVYWINFPQIVWFCYFKTKSSLSLIQFFYWFITCFHFHWNNFRVSPAEKQKLRFHDLSNCPAQIACTHSVAECFQWNILIMIHFGMCGRFTNSFRKYNFYWIKNWLLRWYWTF